MRNLSEHIPTDVRVYVIPMPAKVRSFLCERNGCYTICINECLSEEARLKAYRHEIYHLEHDDLHSDLPTGLIEIRAHNAEKGG